MFVVDSGAHGGEEHRTHVLMALSRDQPAGHNNSHKEKGNENPSLLSTLNLERVKMHVELRSDVTVQDGVDVLQMDSSGLLVPAVGKGVGLVEVATTGSESLTKGGHFFLGSQNRPEQHAIHVCFKSIIIN